MAQYLSNFTQQFSPKEEAMDAVNKLRISQPQALIDTDFEYGSQITKWENLGLTNNRPFAYNSSVQVSDIASMTQASNSKTVTVVLNTLSRVPNAVAASTPSVGSATYTTSANHGFFVGQYVRILGSSIAGYNGIFLIDEVPSATTFVVANATTGTPVFTSATAVGNVAPPNGNAITVSDSLLRISDGTFLIESGEGTSTFTYFSSNKNTTNITNIFDANKTLIYNAINYTNSQIGTAPTVTYTGTKVTVTTTVPHGLSLGNQIAITGLTASTNAPNGSFFVATVTSPTQFIFYAEAAPTGTLVATSGKVFCRPQASFLHRPFDGGVIFSANGNSNNQQAIRQTRRYFRYQSGKGIQYSSGSLFRPSFQLDQLTHNSGVITIQTKEFHNLTPGAAIAIVGANEEDYNGEYTVQTVLSYNKIQVSTNKSIPAIASGRYYLIVRGWNGSTVRSGIFDEQNGLFFEYDGTNLYAVKRSSTYQISGRVTVTNGSSTVTQTTIDFPTNFSRQLNVGGYIVIRGQSYLISAINSDTELIISPAYRGASGVNVTVSKTEDVKIEQSAWNIDKCDGTGYSGYNLELDRMQMFYIDYSWYGAGFVRWGLRGPDGNVLYVHKMQNNNVNLEAYMRSGNLPGRYETATFPARTKIISTFGASDSTLNVSSTSGFPSSGTLTVRTGGNLETLNYSGKTGSQFLGITRAAAGVSSINFTIADGSNVAVVSSVTGLQVGQRIISSEFPDETFIVSIDGTTLVLSQSAASANVTGVIIPPMSPAASEFVFSETAETVVELAYPTFSPTLSHWGTSVIMDGQYDDDKSLLFTYGQSVTTSVAAQQTRALFSIRVAPSVDNGISGVFGARELINRMQLILRALDISATSPSSNLLVRAILNGRPTTATAWTNAVGNIAGSPNSSLAQIADYAGGTTRVFGGEVVAGFFTAGTTQLDLSIVRDLGNAILGGGSTLSSGQPYPDGPDTLTIVVTNVGSATATVLGRLAWTEAQA